MTEKQARIIGLKILYIFRDGWSLVSEDDKVVINDNYENEIHEYKSWKELLDEWKDSVKTDIENDLLYLTNKEYKLYGLDKLVEETKPHEEKYKIYKKDIDSILNNKGEM